MGTSIPPIQTRIKGDNADAQAKIRETIATVEKMARTVNLQSGIARTAIRSEIQASQDRLRVLGATERQQEKLGTVSRKVEGQITSAQGRAASAARQAAAGFETILRSGQATGAGLRQVLQSGADIAFMFGPAGAIAGALAFVALGFVNAFSRANEAIEETKKKALAALEDVRKGGDSIQAARLTSERFGELEKARAELRAAQAALAAPTLAPGQAPVIGLGGQNIALDAARAEATMRVADAERQVAAAVEAHNDALKLFGQLNAQAAERTAFGLRLEQERLRVTEARAAAEREVQEALKLTNELARQEAQIGRAGLGPGVVKDISSAQPIRDVLPGPADTPQLNFDESVSAAGSLGHALDVLRASLDELAGDAEQSIGVFPTIAEAAGDAVVNVGKAAFNAAIAGKGKVIKQLKAAAAEPIVAKLKMEAVDEFVSAARAAAKGNFAGAGAHLLAAAKATAGAVIVARLGGIGGGGGPGGGGGGAAGAAARGREDAESLEGAARARTEIVIQGGLLDMTDPRQRDALAKALEDIDGVGNVTIRAG